MEGCPRSLMLNVDQKETFPTEFTAALKTYIREHYNEDADSYKNECSQLEQLRSASLRPSRDHSGCSTLRRYYAQLQFLQSRFPMEDGGAVNVQFTWTDLYSEEPIALCDVKFEQAAILHNLAALHSQLGCNEDRTAEEGMKVACTHFQAAAGIFQYLKAGSFCKVEHFIDHFANDAVFDMASALLQMYTNVMLGQAQECLLEKSILDSRKDSLIARISMQVHDYYNQALQFMDSQGPSYMGSRKAKLWTKSLKIKCCQFLAVAYIYMSNNADENQKFGEKVAYLKAASQKITEAQKASKGQSERTLELLQFLIDVVSNKLQGAVKDNDFIYHEVVPELDTLPEIKAAPLVKPIPFQPCDPSVSGPDIFQRLIPMGAHTDSSLYSEEKAKLLRRYVASIELKNQLLSKALSDLHIDDLLEPEGYDVLPDAIRQKSNSLKTDGNLKEAEGDFEELTKIGSKVEERLETLAKILEEDKRREKELEALLGPITSLPKKEDLVKELEQCQESHKKAMQTNTELLKVFKEHKHNLDLLVGPSEGLLAALPSLNIIDTPIDDGAVQRLRDLISKVELMKTQRKQFEADLRKQLAEDDITQLLVTREEGNKTLFFEEQLKKHSAACDLIQKNVDAQDKILKALTEANAKYAPTRQAVKETAQRRDDAVRAFVLSHDTFFELKEKLSAGLRFYQGLEKTVLKLEEKLKDLAEKRKKELDRIDEKEKEKKAKEKAKTVPARPGAEKPQHLVNPSPSSLGSPVVGQYPGVPGVPHPSMRPVAPNPRPQGIPFQPRMPGGAFPPGSFPGSMPPRPADPRVFPGGSLGVPARPPPPPGDARMRAPHPGLPPQTPPDSRTQQMFSDQSVPKASASPVPGPPVQPSMQPRPTLPFSQVGPRGPVPTEHLIHSTPRMSYPVPVGPSLPPGAPQGVQPAIPPGSPYQASQQPRPQLLPKQDPGPVSAQGLPSYDLAKLLPGSQPMIRPQQPPLPSQQGFPRGQNPSASQQQSGGPQLHPGQLNHLPSVTPQQQFQGPRGPHPPSQPQLTSQGGAPQMYQQHVPSGQMSQPLQPPSQHQPKNWSTQPFQFPKLAQQSMQPLQPQQQIQQPNPQQPFQQLPPGQPPFPPPLQPQTVRPPQSQIPQQFQPQQPSQHPSLFQQQQPPQQQLQHPPLPPHQFQQPTQQFKQPGRVQSQFPQPQQPVLPPREPLQPTQFQTTLQSKGQQQQFQQLIQPPPNYPQQVPLQPQKPQQQSQFQPPLPLQPHSMQQSPQGQQFPSERLPQQIPHPGQPISQNIQTSLGSLKTQQGGKTPEMPPKGPPQMGQMSQRPSWQQESTTAPPKPPAGYPAQQSYSGYNQGQQLTQTSNVSTQLGYPVLPEKKRSQTDQLTPRPSQEGYPSQHPKVQRPGGVQPPQQQNTPAGSTSNWPYTQASQSLPSSGVPQQFSRQDSQEKPQGFGGKQGEGPPQVSLYRQTSVDQGWGSPLGDQNPPQGERPQNPRTYPPTLARQNLSEYDKQSQYQGQSRGRLASYPPYSGGVSEPPSAPPGGGQSYSCTPGSAPTAPPLVQGVRPSPTSLPPSSAYATSYSVSVAQAQLSQQQQMQQLQTQMLLQQQQLIIQQQELLRHQQQQQQHESDQGHITQLFQQVLQQQTKLAEMEQKLAEHERHEEGLKNEHTKTEGEKTSPIEEDKDAADKELHSPGKGPEIGGNDLHTAGKDPHSSELDPHVIPPHSSSNFGASWGKGFCDHSHGKLDMSQVFSDLAKKQINEISETSKHTDGTPHSSKPLVHGGDESSMLKIDCDTTEHSEKEVVVDELSETKGASEMDVIDSEVNKEPAQLTDKNSKRVKETESSLELKENDKGKSEASATSTELKQDGEHGVTAGPSDEDKEKRRRQEIEEQIQKIKELQKHTQPAPPPLPQKQRYLYEPGKMPELDQLPLKPPDKATAEDQNKPSLHRQCGHYYNTQLSRIGQDENNECLSDEEYIQRLCRTVETFDALVVSLGQKRENSSYNGFISEWKVLDKMQKTDSAKFSTQAATLNPSKNRYRDVLPWDHTRVKLTTKEGGDYINANVIKKVTPLSPDYIMTQGPIAATLGDFWLMVWEQKAPVVVMLTKEVEGNRLKCHQYWPIDEGHTVVYGLIRVHMRSVNHGQAWVKRIMHVQHAESDEVLVVSHLQFVGWPDHGVPHSPSDLLTFLSEVHNHHQEKDPQTQRPFVVHCSAGVGRAGTFCIIYTAIRELHGTRNIVNIPKLVRIFRKHRKLTVQKKEQYEFCYRAILFYANQFVQLEKAAIAFKKSKVAPGDQSGEMSSMSSVTSLDSSGQRKPDEVSFLGEISDEDSSESGDEFDNEQSDVRDINSQGYAESGLASTVMSESELNRTVLENAEVKVPSEITNRPGTSNTKGCPDKCGEGIASVEDEKLKSDTCTSSIAGTLECPETSTFDADLSTTNKNPEEVEEDVSSAQTSKVQSASVTKNEASSASAGLSATNVETAQNREVKDSSVCSDASKSSTDVEIAEVEANDSTHKQGDCNSEKGGCGDDKGCVSGEVVPVDSTQKQGDCNSEKGGCGDDKGCVSGEVVPVEGNATGRKVSTPESKEVDVSKEKSKTEPSSEKDVDVKNGDVEIKGNEVIHRRNSDVQMNEKTDKSESVSKEKSNPVGELKKEGAPKENQKQENDMDHSTPEKGILNHQEDEEPDKEEQHENVDTEQNETAEEKQPDSEKTASGDDKEKDKESDSYEKMKFGIQSQETGES